MESSRLQQWLLTSEGLSKALLALVGAPLAVLLVVSNTFEKFLPGTLPWWAPALVAGALSIGFFWMLWHGYRRFDRSSRLDDPDSFTLRPRTPSSLIGRAADLGSLLQLVKRFRLVLLDGDSGCGKSALVSAGLIPELERGSEFFPLLIRDWGEEWNAGPLASALDALWSRASIADRDRLSWRSAPNLTADSAVLAASLDQCLSAVYQVLGKRPLLIADQFDDHQAQHRDRFLDNDGNWLSPAALSERNAFWQIVSSAMNQGRLHLMVVTRSDTAAGLACIRFLSAERTVNRTLPKVEQEYLRPLLINLAPDNAQPPVVSNPAEGWHELRERLERDLKAEGAILMQQVRTVLLGLRQLDVLTPKRYLAVGGLRGVETLMVSRALQLAAHADGGSDASVGRARAVLGKLILPGDASQPPKAQRASLATLGEATGGLRQAETILGKLQEAEVARPAESADRGRAWQLDHDYLARAVMAEARQADRWASALREGKARYGATSAWRQRWGALLPASTLTRILWERIFNRLSFGESTSYVGWSALKQATMMAIVVGAVGLTVNWNQSRLLTEQARDVIGRIGSSEKDSAVLEVWRSEDALRRRVYEIVRSSSSLLEQATNSAWPLAHAGLEAETVRQAAAALRDRLVREKDGDIASSLARSYEAVAERLQDPEAVKSEAAALRDRLVQEKDGDIASRMANSYEAVARRLQDPEAVKSEAAALRDRLVQEKDDISASILAESYEAVAERLQDPEAVKSEAAALRDRLVQEKDGRIASSLATSYAAVAALLQDPKVVESEVAALRDRLVQEKDDFIASSLAISYAAVAALLQDPKAVNSAAAVLRDRLVQQKNGRSASRMADSYAAVAKRLQDPKVVESEVAALRDRLVQEKDRDIAIILASSYEAVAKRLQDPKVVESEVAALRDRLVREKDGFIARSLAGSYAAVAARLQAPKVVESEVAALRDRLVQEKDDFIASSLAISYAAVAALLQDPKAVNSAAAVLRDRLVQEKDRFIASSLADSYAAVAKRLQDPKAVESEAAALRDRLVQEKNVLIASSLVRSYKAVAALLKDPKAVESEVAALRNRLVREKDRFIASSLARSYEAVAKRLQDPKVVESEVAVLRDRLVQEKDDFIASSLARSYAAVAALLQDPKAVNSAAAVLRDRLVQEKDDISASSLADSYAAVAERLQDPKAVESEAAALRDRLVREKDRDIASSLARSYEAVAKRLQDPKVVESEVAALRDRLVREKDRDIASSLARSYAAVAALLQNPKVVKSEAAALRDRLVQEKNGGIARSLAKAYAAVVAPFLQKADEPARHELVRDVLVLSGHPFMPDASVILASLDAIAHKKFGSDSGAAAAWASKTYGISQRELRPTPVQRRQNDN